MNQRGVIQVFVPLILIVGIIAGVYLVQQTQIFKPKASVSKTFNIGVNIPGATHYGYIDQNSQCLASVPYFVGGLASGSTTNSQGANLYVDPQAISQGSSVKVTATGDAKCSINIYPDFGGGLADCKGGCGLGGVKDGCTCDGGNPKDSKSCWWRWTCNVSNQGSHTATFTTTFFDPLASKIENIDAHLKEAQRMGATIVRIWPANKNISDAEAAKRLGEFLDKANQYGISAIISLINFYGDNNYYPQGTEQYYTGNWNGIPLLGHEFFESGYKGRYKEFVKTLVEATKNKTNIYAWQPGNELKDDSSPQTFINFMNDISSVIKSIQPSAKISTGMIRASHTGLSPEALYSQLPNIDIITVHTYEGNREGVQDVEWAKNNGKEVIIGEFGFTGGDRPEKIKTEVDFWKNKGVSAILQWAFVSKDIKLDVNASVYGMDAINYNDYDKLFNIYKEASLATSSSQTSFILESNASDIKKGIKKGDTIEVKLLARSDTEAANLFVAKINYNKSLLAVDRIDVSNSFINNWVEQVSDNQVGTIYLSGGVPNPGFKSNINLAPALMAKIYFKALAAGSTEVVFDNSSAIYSNSNNTNILNAKKSLIISIEGIRICVQVITTAKNPQTGECKDFPTSCDVPAGWERITSCSTIIKSSPTPTPSASAVPILASGTGDGNGDGKINLVDLSILLSDFNKTSGFRKGIDLNTDNKINSFDSSLLRNKLIQNGVIK